ncbi:hypothetical protein D3B04_11645 [Listeria monocytogenes]|nr:hypothetical protein D3B04_11645 [Listeria monocytogenes]
MPHTCHLIVRSEDDYKNKSYIESALHFSYPILSALDVKHACGVCVNRNGASKLLTSCKVQILAEYIISSLILYAVCRYLSQIGKH